MRMRGGYNLRLAGKPVKTLESLLEIPETIAVKAQDIPGIKPLLAVEEGAKVKCGDVLFTHKKDPRISVVAPMAGTVKEIRRGHRRALIEVIIELGRRQNFGSFGTYSIEKISEQELVDHLLKTGMWPFFRSIPFHQLADPEDRPKDIYVKTLETEPHCPDLNYVLKGKEEDLRKGIILLKKLTRGNVFLTAARTDEPYPSGFDSIEEATVIRTEAVFPAGNPHVQSYHVSPLKKNECAWYIDAQDLLAIVHLLETGKWDPVRTLTIAGAQSLRPRYVETYLGSSVKSLVDKDLADGEKRFLSGGVFSGLQIEEESYLGFYGKSLHVVREGVEREFLRFVWPGMDKYSFSSVFLSTVFPSPEYELTTSIQGEDRACIQCSSCEDVCPTDLLPQFVFKSVLAEDFDQMEGLGIQDCAECGLCTYVCPSKIEIEQIIKGGLDTILKEA
jgi:Na+-transporting NADH:ubiquinone oxidoreductase subunit A